MMMVDTLPALNCAVTGNARAAGREVWNATDRVAWLARREKDVTASAAAALLAASPYETPFQLYMRKAGFADPVAETAAMRRGTLLEAVHVQMLADERADWAIERGAIYIRDPAARVGATPDVFATRPAVPGVGIVQLKSVSPEAFRALWRIEGSHEAEPPAYVQIQAMVEADMAGASWAAVSAMVIGAGIDLHLFEIEVRPKVIAAVRAETAEFWRRVATGEPYPADYLADGDFILSNWRDRGAPQIDLTADPRAVALMAMRAALKDAEKAGADAAKARKTIDAELTHKLGNASRALIGDEIFSAERRNRKGFVVESSAFTVCTVKPAKEAA